MQTKTIRFNLNPMNLILSPPRKQGLRIGYMESTLRGFFLNSLKTGVASQRLSDLLLNEFNCIDTEAACQRFRFLIDEGDRTAYKILAPYLLSTDNLEEFEDVVRKRFFGIDRFVQQGKNLYNFVKYAEERKEPIIWINDLERGIIGWDMGLLVGLVRAARECGYIDKLQAWEYIEEASELCAGIFHTPEQIDKSFLIGRAMKTDQIKEWELLIQCYSLINKNKK